VCTHTMRSLRGGYYRSSASTSRLAVSVKRRRGVTSSVDASRRCDDVPRVSACSLLCSRLPGARRQRRAVRRGLAESLTLTTRRTCSYSYVPAVRFATSKRVGTPSKPCAGACFCDISVSVDRRRRRRTRTRIRYAVGPRLVLPLGHVPSDFRGPRPRARNTIICDIHIKPFESACTAREKISARIR